MDDSGPKREQFEDDPLVDGDDDEDPNELLGFDPNSENHVWLVKVQ